MNPADMALQIVRAGVRVVAVRAVDAGACVDAEMALEIFGIDESPGAVWHRAGMRAVGDVFVGAVDVSPFRGR